MNSSCIKNLHFFTFCSLSLSKTSTSVYMKSSKMHSVRLSKSIKDINDAFNRHSNALCTAEPDMLEDNEVLPRIGDEYQADIPPLHLKNKELDHPDTGKDKEGSLDIQRDAKMGITLDEPLSGVRRDSLLLGLYLFGKNFSLLKRIVGSKTMGCIQSFYYGKFFRSDDHHKWSKLRKLKNGESLVGEQILNRWRRQELLSRMCSRVSEECKKDLVEVSRRFEDGNISFEEYIFGLKDAGGISLLIEAIGIGKGKQDLTGIALERMKTKNAFSVRPALPVGQACSYLSLSEIIKFLTGGFRLSKARASDLFWEAVWPRLLARGWNSEQPKDSLLYSQKNSLVFLLPGVKKFTKKLVKGKHYFDSVSDVLNKVASEPGLLELELEEDKGNKNSEVKIRQLPIKQDKDIVSNEQGNHYLRPCFLDCNKEPKDEAKDTNDSSLAKSIAERVACADLSNHLDSNISVEEDHKNQSSSDDKQPKEYLDCQFKQKANSEPPNHLAPEILMSEELAVEKPKLRKLTNLKISCMPQDYGTNETKASAVHNAENVELSDQQPTLNNWRHSTRNRLLTVKAWEAREFGFLDTKGKRKGETTSTSTSTSNQGRRVRQRTGNQASFAIYAHNNSLQFE